MNKLNKLSRAIFAIAMILTIGFPSIAHDFEVDGIYYNHLDETAKTVEVKYKGNYVNSYSNEYSGSVTIPSSVTYNSTTYSVTSIGSYAFSACSGLTSISIPNSVTEIGLSAFHDCTGLTSVTIGNSVTYIDFNAFYGCTGLTSISIPNSVTHIEAAFDGCTSLTKLILEDGAESISGVNFTSCPIETFYLGRNTSDAFVREITTLKEVTIGNYVDSIVNDAFAGCTGITLVNYNAENCTSMGSATNSVFRNCSNLKTINIGSSVKTIPNYAFDGCTSLTEVNFNAENCITMSSATNSVFRNCSNLKTVNIGSSVKTIPNNAFAGCKALTSVTIGNSVTSISNRAFYNCTGLASISIPNSVTTIGDRAFYRCTGLTSVTIGNSVTSIGESAFYNCTGLASISIPNSVTTIGNHAFYNCTGLASISIPNSVTSIGTSAFYGCKGLTKLILEDGTERISGLSFTSSPIESLYLGRNTLDSFVKGKTSLKELTIGNSVTSIGPSTFYGCSGLTSISIPNSVTSIGVRAFYNCTGLTSIYGGKNIETVKDKAFWGCDKLVNCDSIVSNYLSVDLALSTPTQYTPIVKYNNEIYSPQNGIITINNLAPSAKYEATQGFKINNSVCEIKSIDFSTKEYILEINGEVGCTSIKASGYYPDCEITIKETSISIGNKVSEYNDLDTLVVKNLDPQTSYTIYYGVKTKESGEFSTFQKFTTKSLIWNSGEYAATSTSSVRLSVETNCDATEGTGYEWKRYDAPESLKPNKAPCPIVNGKLVGSLRGLNSIAYYNCRPYYTSSSGKTYYGEWFTVFSGDANVYFEPEVSTSDNNEVVDNSAVINGYALAGSDDILEQGFEYWKTASSTPLDVNGIMTIKASGISMSATITNLEYNSTYRYRAYVKTQKGTFYGSEKDIVIGEGLTGVDNIETDAVEAKEIARFNIHGHRLSKPTKGLNIVVYSDGSTRKEIVK